MFYKFEVEAHEELWLDVDADTSEEAADIAKKLVEAGKRKDEIKERVANIGTLSVKPVAVRSIDIIEEADTPDDSCEVLKVPCKDSGCSREEN